MNVFSKIKQISKKKKKKKVNYIVIIIITDLIKVLFIHRMSN